MKLAVALQILTSTRKDLPAKNVFLACGFTPLHLQTYLAAHLQRAHPESRVSVGTGLYGDLLGNLMRIPAGTAAVAVVEWSDLDPRLGFRSLGGWTVISGDDIHRGLPARLDSLATHLRAAAQTSMLTLVLPCTPLAPVSFTPPWMADSLSLGIRKLVSEFAAQISECDRIQILNSETVTSFEGTVFQLKSELETGFPYSLAFADFLAERLAVSLAVPTPKKGLITDLDDTLWAGILGEDGPDGVHWTLEGHAQVHGLYQQLLASLADSGVLLGVVSKNDPAVVADALPRLPLALQPDKLFPIAANWERKSHSVREILRTWNIGPQDVVFIDDSTTELEEVQSAFPELTCLQFRGSDVSYSHRLLLQLRCLFGKARLEAEDAIRTATLKGAVRVREEQASAISEDEFIAGLKGTLEVSLDEGFTVGRALDLVNKTNQFNLNGRRYGLLDWAALEAQTGRALVVVEYLDKHGSLGKISVLSGVRTANTFKVDAWVMSCRAFARRIEYELLDFLFREFRLQTVELAYEPTPKNGPLRDFLLRITGAPQSGHVRVDRDAYVRKCPPLVHEVRRRPLRYT